MSFNIEVLGGKNYLLPTGGKYCPQDIALTAIGNNEGEYCWAKYTEVQILPDGYTLLESLSTTGAEYFDSGYLINPTTSSKNLRIVADVAISLPTTSVYHVTGHGGAQPLVYLGITNSKRYGYANGSADVATSVSADGNRHLWTLDYKNGKFKVDNVVDVTFSPQNITASANFYISAYNMSGTATNKHIEQIYSWEFYENDILIKRLVPCLDSSGVCCLYDLIGGNPIYASGGTPVAGGVGQNPLGFDEYVVSDDESAYPDGGMQDGCYYERVSTESPYAEGSESNTFKAYSYTFNIDSLGFEPKVVYFDAIPYSNAYSQNSKTVVANKNGGQEKLVEYRSATYASPPLVTIGENGFSALVYAPAGNYGSYDSCGATITWKAWG